MPSETDLSLGQTSAEDLPAANILGDLFSQHRKRLRLMVQLRLDKGLQGRIDASDVVQCTLFSP